jgi:hypothetical protein
MAAFYGYRGRKLILMSININLADFKANQIYNQHIRSTPIIQVQSMNVKLNMKDINKILIKAHFKYKF